MSVLKVIKKNGKEQKFDVEKIKKALSKANKATSEDSRLTEEQFEKVMKQMKSHTSHHLLLLKDIQFRKIMMM